jgi:hypothetical protein
MIDALPSTKAIAPPVDRRLHQAILQLHDYCRKHDWAGSDPYDGLNSRLFSAIPWLRSRWPRLVFIQLMKRSPVNFRPLLRVPVGHNPKGIALFLSALIRLTRLGLTNPDEPRALADLLIKLRAPEWEQSCWGYNFDWQTRTYLVPRHTPNIICTTFAGHALLDAFDYFRDPMFLETAASAASFVLDVLGPNAAGHMGCFSYTPLDHSRIHNANLLGAAYLARVYHHTQNAALRDQAILATRFSVQKQAADGSWIYGEDPHQRWIDSFHTGYNLLALKMIEQFAATNEFRPSLQKGFQFYLDRFLLPDGRVKYYDNRIYPLDIHALAHAIITLVELTDLNEQSGVAATKVFDWTSDNMRHPSGYFYFQKWPWMTNRIPYIRWAQGWMLLALATLAEQTAGRKDSHCKTRTKLGHF